MNSLIYKHVVPFESFTLRDNQQKYSQAYGDDILSARVHYSFETDERI